MSDGFRFERLKAAILALSRATNWAVARREWSLIDVYEADEPDTCLCGHTPIIEICVIKNGTTLKVTEVGNVCVKRFLGIRSDLIFKAIKRIRKDSTKSLNEDALAFFRQKGIFTDREYEFLQDTRLKRNLSAAQIGWRTSLNERVLSAIKRRGFQAF